jgi:hypothetical protein
MATIQASRADLFRAAAELSPPEFEGFVSDLLALRAKRSMPSTSEEELLYRINHSLPDEVRRRYRELSAKVSNETIAPEEHAELLLLIDKVENSDAERVRALGQLAQVRKKSLTELMQELGIQAPPYE